MSVVYGRHGFSGDMDLSALKYDVGYVRHEVVFGGHVFVCADVGL